MGNQTRKATEYLVVVPRRVPWLLAVVGGDNAGVVVEKIKRGNRSKGLGREWLVVVSRCLAKRVGLPESRRMTYTVQEAPVLTRGSSITIFLQYYKIFSYAPIPYKCSTALVSFSIETMVDKSGRWVSIS